GKSRIATKRKSSDQYPPSCPTKGFRRPWTWPGSARDPWFAPWFPRAPKSPGNLCWALPPPTAVFSCSIATVRKKAPDTDLPFPPWSTVDQEEPEAGRKWAAKEECADRKS